MQTSSPYQPIENYGIIGDLSTTALVGMDGSIDFMCFPDFDSPTIFAAMLDHEKGGRFKIAPKMNGTRKKQMYLPNTNVLISRFLSEDGVAEITDFMPVEEDGNTITHELVRQVTTVRGEVEYELTCWPQFNYARSSHQVQPTDQGVYFFSEGPDELKLFLRSSVPLQVSEKGAATARFRLKAGEKAFFVLEKFHPYRESPSLSPGFVPEAFRRTVNYWRMWVRKSQYKGRWREMVNRSALTLKLLTSQKYGSIVAAPTFGLPEEIGGVRNWDYRYTWIRDASFTLYGLIRLGYTQEAHKFMHWYEDRCKNLNPDGSLQIMYGIDGHSDLSELTLFHFEGYRQSKPVRIGNGAYKQLQLDIYGELMDAVYLYNKYGEPVSHDLWENLVKLIEWVCRNWQRPDEGIWEIRGASQEFLHSRLMCWVAIDRGIRLAMKRSFPAPLEDWYKVRDSIYHDIFKNFWSEEKQAFVQAKGSETLDAAVLLMPLVRFISPTDPKWLSTLNAIGRELSDDSLVYRYNNDEAMLDGLTGREGTFCMCSFWYIECLSRAGRLEEARLLLEKMFGYANHLGLYAEELGPSGEHLGNFPQAFTHLALISAAFNLDRNLTDARRKGGQV